MPPVTCSAAPRPGRAPEVMAPRVRIGIDLGGSKIAGVALAADGRELARLRLPTPQGSYEATLAEIARMIAALEAAAGSGGTIGIGMPGSLSPATGRVQNANSTWLNGRALKEDLERALGRPVRLAEVDAALRRRFESVFGRRTQDAGLGTD